MVRQIQLLKPGCSHWNGPLPDQIICIHIDDACNSSLTSTDSAIVNSRTEGVRDRSHPGPHVWPICCCQPVVHDARSNERGLRSAWCPPDGNHSLLFTKRCPRILGRINRRFLGSGVANDSYRASAIGRCCSALGNIGCIQSNSTCGAT
mgnify:CR=1 FL=1